MRKMTKTENKTRKDEMKNIIEIKEEVKIGNVILEKGDRIEVLEESVTLQLLIEDNELSIFNSSIFSRKPIYKATFRSSLFKNLRMNSTRNVAGEILSGLSDESILWYEGETDEEYDAIFNYDKVIHAINIEFSVDGYRIIRKFSTVMSPLEIKYFD